MNKLDFSVRAGWPASTETWEFLQDMILNAQNIALLGGKNYILDGCVEAGGNVAPGLMVIKGEVLPFAGGPIQPKVIVVDVPVDRAFFGGAINTYYHNRQAVFGTGAGEVLYNSLKRNDPDNGVLARLDKVERMLKPLMGYDVAGTTTYGSWLFWGRPAAEIPDGWEAVPDADWKGKVPLVLDDTDVDFNTVGNTGGSKTHTLDMSEIPAHDHDIPQGNSFTGSGGGGRVGRGNDSPNIMQTSVEGAGLPHNNLQPYKVVMFIRFIG